jgi:hypothetical protein
MSGTSSAPYPTTESSTNAARDLLAKAWGMVSLPALKSLSLQASRILKGAAVANRIEIAGISCFVLSKAPVPELAAAICFFQQKHWLRSQACCTLSTKALAALASLSYVVYN